MSEFRALFIHGIGTQGKGYADDARRALRASLKARGVAVHFESVHWAPLADRIQDSFLAAAKKRGSSGGPAQKLAVGTLADALMYLRHKPLRDGIFGQIERARAAFGGHPYTIFGHSLGGLCATDFLRERGGAERVRLITLGCNIGLFNLGSSFESVPGLKTWLNVWDDDDAMGFPLGIDPALCFVRDIEVSVGVTGLAHTQYWDSSSLWAETIPGLLFPPERR